METFDLQEALLLSVGVEPKHFAESSLSVAKKAMSRKPLLKAVEFLVRRHEQFQRKFPSGGYGPLRVSPQFLLGWFDEIALAVHPSFVDALRKREERKKSAVASPRGEATLKPDRREVEKMAQLFTAMAVDYLGYDPKASRSPIPKEIGSIAASMGLEISDDTIRKYLKLGAKHIPDDWQPK